MPSKELKKKCCKSYKKKGKYCKRCPLKEASLPSIDRDAVKEELKDKETRDGSKKFA